jgi:hypothetical protein
MSMGFLFSYSFKTARYGISLDECLREEGRQPQELGSGCKNCWSMERWRTLYVAAVRHTYIGEDKFTADKSRVTLR